MKHGRGAPVSIGWTTMPNADPLRQELLLLSRDLRFGGRDLRLEDPETAGAVVVEQMALPGFTVPPQRQKRRRSRPADPKPGTPPADDALLSAFLTRLAAHGCAR